MKVFCRTKKVSRIKIFTTFFYFCISGKIKLLSCGLFSGGEILKNLTTQLPPAV
jgi:hypothetical protein